MAQVVKLKRTAVQGKVPSISNVELGELAINTYDGRIFFEKSSSAESIQEILTTNAGRPITGSINLNGAITASYFKGDGSALTNIQATVSEQVTVTSSFESESTIDIAHNFSSKNVIVSVYDSSDSLIIPQSVSLTDTDNVRVVLASAQSGFVVVAKGGHIVSGSADDSNRLNGQLASYYLNYNNFTNVPSGLVSGSDQVASTFAQTILDDTSAGAVRTTIGVDAAGTDNSTDVTLAGTPNYITISGQVITRNTIDIGDDTNLTAGTGITLTGDTLSTTDSEIVHDNLSGFVANEHIDHSTITVGSGKGLQGGGTIDTSRSLSLHTGSAHFTSGVKDKLNTEGVLSGSSHSGDQTFDDNVIVTGNLTVNGTTTSVNSNTVNIGDNIIVLNSDESGTPSQDAGIEIERGTSTNVRFQFKESTDRWQFSNDGSTYFNLPTSTADVAEFANLYYTDTRVKTKLNTEGVISGSSQITSLSSITHSGDLTINNGGDLKITNSNNASGRIYLGDTSGTQGSSLIDSSHNLEINIGTTANNSALYIKHNGTNRGVFNSSGFSLGTGANVNTILDSGDAFVDNDTSLMTAASIDDRINTRLTSLNSATGSYLTELPSGVVSGSSQLNNTEINTLDVAGTLTAVGTFAADGDVTLSGLGNKGSEATALVIDGSNQVGTRELGSNAFNSTTYLENLNGTGIISGSSQITDLTTHKETVSGASSYAVTHNLNEQYPIVQCWDTSTSQQVQASDVTSNSANQVTVNFAINFAGVIIVKK